MEGNYFAFLYQCFYLFFGKNLYQSASPLGHFKILLFIRFGFNQECPF
jgi:hypothetical protein